MFFLRGADVSSPYKGNLCFFGFDIIIVVVELLNEIEYIHSKLSKYVRGHILRYFGEIDTLIAVAIGLKG